MAGFTSQGSMRPLQGKIGTGVVEGHQAVLPVMAARTILVKVQDMTSHEVQVVGCMAGAAFLGPRFERGRQIVAGLAPEGGEIVIDLVLHQTEIRDRMVECRQGRQARVEAGSAVIAVAGRALLDAFYPGMQSHLGIDLNFRHFVATKAKHILGGLQRLVAKLAAMLELGMACIAAYDLFRDSFSAQMPRAKQSQSFRPDRDP